MFGSGHRVRGGRVDNEAAMLSGGGEVHIVDPDPGAPDDPKPTAGGLEDVAADLGAAPHDESVAERDLGTELLGGEVVGAVDVREALEEVQPTPAEFLGDQDTGLRVRLAGLLRHRDEPRAAVAEEGGGGEAGVEEGTAGEGEGISRGEDGRHFR